MTPAELLALADAATPGPWQVWDKWPTWVRTNETTWAAVVVHTEDANSRKVVDARLIALAPDLARLCAEMGEALEAVRDAAQEWGVAVDYEWLSNRANAALAKLSELEART